VKSGKDLNDELKMVKFSSIAWTHDGKGFFYQACDGLDHIATTCLYFLVLPYRDTQTRQAAVMAQRQQS